MIRNVVLLACGALASGCVVYTNDDPVPAGPANYTPYVSWADGGCYYDPYYVDDIWYFEANVEDPDGIYDVTNVYADVYDGRTGEWVETFELFPTADPSYWFSDWLGSTTWLDCYYGGYEVDIVAYDSFNDYGSLTFLPFTYNYY